MGDKIKINGNQYDAGSTSLKIDDEPIYGFTAINWGQKRERQKGYGAGRDRTPRGRGRGKYTAEVLKLTVWRDTATEIQKQLAAKSANGKSYGNPEVPIVLQYVEEESNQDPVTVEFVDCTYESDANASEDEGGLDKVEITFDVMRLTVNDLTLYDSTESA